MKKIRAAIIDDEPLARRGIRQLLAVHEDVEIVGEARNGREASDVLQALSPDLVFLDVQMPEASGFDLLEQIAPASRPEVIFITAYDSFAVKAFDERALDYLVKPIHAARFDDALARARARLLVRQRRLVIPTGDGDLILDLPESGSRRRTTTPRFTAARESFWSGSRSPRSSRDSIRRASSASTARRSSISTTSGRSASRRFSCATAPNCR